MAGGRKEFEMLFKISASMGGNFSSTFKNATAAIKGLQNGLTKINSIQSKVAGFQKQTQAVEANKNKLAQLNAEHERLQQQLRNTENPSEALRQKLARNETQIANTTAKIQQQQTALKGLENELQQSGVNTNRLTEENARLEKSYKKIQQSQQNIAKINAKQQKNNEAISSAKGQMAGTIGAATAAAAAIYAGPVKAAANFESQMSTVQSISGASASELEKLKEAAKAAGRTTQFSAVESGQALEYMAMAGWKTNQMVDGLPGIMNLAAASGEDLASTSDIVTDALSAFKLQAKDAAHFSDVLAQASSSSNTNVSMMGESFKYVASTAGALGYSAEDVAIALGTMANNGIKGSMSGTSLKNMLVNLAKPTDKIAKQMQALNISLTDSNGEMLPLNKLLANMRQSFAGLSKDQKAAAAATIAGKEGMSGLLAIINTSEGDFNSLSNAINNADGAAERMAAIRLDNYEGQMTLCKSAVEALQIAVGNALLPTITSGLKNVTDFISKLAEWADKNPALVKTIMTTATALVGMRVAGLGLKIAFLDIQNGLLQIDKVFEYAKGGIGLFEGKLLKMPKAITTILNPFNKLISLVGKIPGPTGKIVGLFGKLSGVVSGMLGPVAGLFTPWIKIFTPLISTIGKFVGIFGPILPVAGAIMGIVVAAQLLTNHLQDIRKLVLDTFGYGGLKAFDGFISAISTIGNTIQGIFTNENFDAAREKINNLFGPEALTVFDGAITVLQAVGGAFMTIWNTVNTYVTPLVEQLFSYVVNTVLPSVGAKFAEWAPTIATIISNLADTVATAIQVTATIIKAVVPVIKNVFEIGFGAIATVIGTVLTLIEKVSSAARGVKNVVTKVFGGGKTTNGGLPGFAGGTNNTPDTFVAGEEGPEIVTNAPGYKVYTASETKRIFNIINKSNRQLPFGGKSASGGINANLNYNPTIIIDGSRPNDLEEKLDRNNEKMFEKFKQWLKDEEENERRTVYA